MAKLIVSHEDAAIGHVHAIVGLLNLIQYFYRFSLMLNGNVNVGFGKDFSLDMFSLFLMSLPNLTSFIFVKHVPTENKGDNVTIWKEYRLHNLIFVLQSIILLGLKCYELHNHGIPIKHLQFIKIAITAVRFVCMAAATHYNPPIYTSTIRGAYKDAPAFIRFGLSYSQFAATSIVLCWDISIVMHFVVVAGLQINSFSMTLRKKAKIDTVTFLSIYVFLVGSMIWYAFLPPLIGEGADPITSPLDERLKPFVMGLFTFWVRRQGVNRFLTWLIGPVTTELTYRGLEKLLAA